MNNNNGWVKLYRSLITWEWWDDDVTTKLFIYCLIMANHEDTKWHGVPVKRGSFITSLENLSAGIKKTVQVTRTALNHLQKTGELTSKSTNKGRIITINNYDAYQQSGDTNQQTNAQADNKQLTSNQQATNKQLTSNNNDNNVRIEEDNNIPPYNPPTEIEKPKSNVFVPPTLEEVTAYCIERNNGINPQHFIDYNMACGWKVGTKPMKDWRAAIRTWEQKRKGNQTTQTDTPHVPSEMERAKSAFNF